MKALISYSLGKKELSIFYGVVKYLESNFVVESTNNDLKYVATIADYSQIKSCNLFIGISTLSGNLENGTNGEIIKEHFKIANENNIPSFLFIEVNNLNEVDITSENQIKFCKSDISLSIKITKKLTELYGDVEGLNGFLDKRELAWIISGNLPAKFNEIINKLDGIGK